jgi:hypothetical protein
MPVLKQAERYFGVDTVRVRLRWWKRCVFPSEHVGGVTWPSAAESCKHQLFGHSSYAGKHMAGLSHRQAIKSLQQLRHWVQTSAAL